MDQAPAKKYEVQKLVLFSVGEVAVDKLQSLMIETICV